MGFIRKKNMVKNIGVFQRQTNGVGNFILQRNKYFKYLSIMMEVG
jgi:hypothetical protein